MKNPTQLLLTLLAFATTQAVGTEHYLRMKAKTAEEKRLASGYAEVMRAVATFATDIAASLKRSALIGFAIMGGAALVAAAGGFVLGILWTQGAFL